MVPGLDLAAEGHQAFGKGIRDRLRTTARERPARDMREHEQYETERRARRLLQREKGVRCCACEQRACRLQLEARKRKLLRRTKSVETEARDCEWMTWKVDERSQQLALEVVPPSDERFEDSAVRVAVPSKLCCGFLERTPHDHGRPVVERVSDGHGRLDQVEAELERAKEGRGDEGRVDRRADVVAKSGKCQLRGSRSAADRLLRLDDADGAPGLSKRDTGREAVGAGPYYDRVKDVSSLRLEQASAGRARGRAR
jgi:hypothetical protein